MNTLTMKDLLTKFKLKLIPGYTRIWQYENYFLLLTSKRLFIFNELPKNEFNFFNDNSVCDILIGDIHDYSDYEFSFKYKGERYSFHKENHIEDNPEIHSFNKKENLSFSSNFILESMNFCFKNYPYSKDNCILKECFSGGSKALNCNRLGDFKNKINQLDNLEGFTYKYYTIKEYLGTYYEEIFYKGELILAGLKYIKLGYQGSFIENLKIIYKNEDSIRKLNIDILDLHYNFIKKSLSCSIDTKNDEINIKLIKK